MGEKLSFISSVPWAVPTRAQVCCSLLQEPRRLFLGFKCYSA